MKRSQFIYLLFRISDVADDDIIYEEEEEEDETIKGEYNNKLDRSFFFSILPEATWEISSSYQKLLGKMVILPQILVFSSKGSC